jgi:hypothetical protein
VRSREPEKRLHSLECWPVHISGESGTKKRVFVI